MDGTPAPGATTLGTQPSGTATSTRAAAGSFIGGVVEWYNFFIYGTAAALVLNDVFFPDADPAAGTCWRSRRSGSPTSHDPSAASSSVTSATGWAGGRPSWQH
ncbi:hypothetical protein [Pseudonocardia sp. TMWB2A]|uniref:hypothetical protein n=1 Tax=Pseudonocardia sp. TMWB2A TaxID=687430 RepID=UPI00307E866A